MMKPWLFCLLLIVCQIEFDDKERELESLRRKALTEIKEKSLQTEGPL